MFFEYEGRRNKHVEQKQSGSSAVKTEFWTPEQIKEHLQSKNEIPKRKRSVINMVMRSKDVEEASNFEPTIYNYLNLKKEGMLDSSIARKMDIQPPKLSQKKRDEWGIKGKPGISTTIGDIEKAIERLNRESLDKEMSNDAEKSTEVSEIEAKIKTDTNESSEENESLNRNTDANNQFEKVKNQLQELIEEKEDLERTVRLNQEKINNQSNEIKHKNNTIEAMKGDIKAIKTENNGLRNKNKELEAAGTRDSSRISQLQKELLLEYMAQDQI